MRFKVFALAAIVFLAGVSLYQDCVLRELSLNLRYLLEHCQFTP
jgi:hypothetical protein